MNPRLLMIAALAATAGCAGISKDVATKAEEVRVYEPEELAKVKYEPVKHLRVRAGSAAIRQPGYATAARGIAVMQAEAARLGANGLTNVTCRKYSDVKEAVIGTPEPAFVCDGDAIRVRTGG